MKNARLDILAGCGIINMKRALPISGLLRELDFYMDRNRHLAEWRFLRFTVSVKVNSPICTVKVIGTMLTPFQECSRPPYPYYGNALPSPFWGLKIF